MQDKDQKIIISKLMDKQKASVKRVSYTNFLSESELSLCLDHLKFDNNYIIAGGLEENDRNIIIFYPDYVEKGDNIPIKAIEISYKAKMSHRDILGSLMGLNIKREMIGDILVFDDKAIVFVIDDMVDFILSNLFKVGRQEVSTSLIAIENIPKIEDDFKIIKDTVKSIRLDSVVSSGFLVSRTTALEQIKAGNVYINSKISLKPDLSVKQNDKISIRGKGKIVLSDILGKSKKDRIFIEIKKFN